MYFCKEAFVNNVFNVFICHFLTGCWKGARPVWSLVLRYFNLGNNKKEQTWIPVFHCYNRSTTVWKYQERDREKPTNHKSESKKHGSRAGQEESKRPEREAGGWEKALLLACEDMARERSLSPLEQHSWRGETLDRSRRDGRSNQCWRGEKDNCVICVPLVPLNSSGVSGRRGWDSCSRSWERWRRRGVSHKSSPS